MTDENAGLSEAEIEALKDDEESELDNPEAEAQAEGEPEAKDEADEGTEKADAFGTVFLSGAERVFEAPGAIFSA